MFDQLEMAPPDAILGLIEAFKKDTNPDKVNLSVGVYQDKNGNTPVFQSVKKAEQFILSEEITKNYFPIEGSPEYARVVQELILGKDHEFNAQRRAVTVHTPGGTGGLRVGAELIKYIRPEAKIWVSQPTWPNHANVFRAVGLEMESYPYFDAVTCALDFDAMLSAFQQIPPHNVVLLHGCCHNPTGVDPAPKQWAQIGQVLAERNLLPFLDFAYQGLAKGLEEDAQGVRILLENSSEALVVNSFSKNFGLYNERVGGLTLVAGSLQSAEAALSQVKSIVRRNYSNPPAHGAKVVTTILQSPELKIEWEGEVAEMRSRIQKMREQFVKQMAALGVKKDFSFIQRQTGMFSFTGLSEEQVQNLRDRYSIYIVKTGGRINVAGMTEKNLPILCKALAEVLSE
ncbi:MAG: aspartate/tyrosine/aromatic aminotransferase [Anaerolineales bacterium]|nr:aspartate/tyrosine/aromatic aminotransferase [Anaerolineales bacterium]